MFFLHLPKCAGTSVARALRRQWPDTATFPINAGASIEAVRTRSGAAGVSSFDPVHDLRVDLALYATALRHIDLVYGHVHLAAELTSHDGPAADFVFATVLRDPVERWVSMYRYNRHKERGGLRTDLSPEDWLTTDVGQSAGRLYVEYLADRPRGIPTAQDVGVAIDRLDRLDVIGFSDDLPGFGDAFEEKTGIGLDIRHENASPDTSEEPLSESLLEQVHHLCEADRRIYDAARARAATR